MNASQNRLCLFKLPPSEETRITAFADYCKSHGAVALASLAGDHAWDWMISVKWCTI
jgi:hypothetical protein